MHLEDRQGSNSGASTAIDDGKVEGTGQGYLHPLPPQRLPICNLVNLLRLQEPPMSLYSSGIQLLPRPDRSVLSIGSDITRATLPDFDTVSELAEFTNRLFNWHVQDKIPHLYPQVIFGSTFNFFIIILILIIMVKKIVENKFWLIRIIRRPSGLIIIPNPMLAFLLCAGICCLVFTPFFLTATRQYVIHTAPPRNYILWYSLPWLAFGDGLVWVVWGTYFATPGALLSPQEESALPPLQRFLRRADVISSLVFIIPLLMAVTLVVPAVIGSTQWQDALAMEKRWQAQYSSMPTFTQDMVQQSQQVWFAALKASKIIAATYILWTVYALLMSIALFCVSYNLIEAVREDLARAKRLEEEEVEKEQRANKAQLSEVVVDALQATKRPENKSTERGEGGGIKFAMNKTVNPVQKQRKGLEQALFQIYIQLIGIGPGAAFLGVISLTFALTIYSKLEQPSADGGNLLERWIGGIWLALIYVICLAGALTYLPVIYKSAEDRFQRQAAGQINFKDITKGTAHIRSTFFEANDECMLMSPTSSASRTQDHLDGSVDTFEQSRDISVMTTSKDYGDMGSWDVEAEAISYKVESLSPRLTSGACP